jgi:tryptophanyl-tRNA synthetase
MSGHYTERRTDSVETTERKKIVFSAIQPTGTPTIGNFVGAIRNMVAMQDDYTCFYAAADLHSITVDRVPAEFRKNVTEMVALLLACGIDPEKSTFFVQSHVSAHAELTWLLNCNTMFGEAKRMTQFKDKSKKHPENVNVGLFDYPVLMAADILLYRADYVPVGIDQMQHVELARNIAERFNNKYSPTFTVPEGVLPKFGAKVQSLADPTVKMSKSDDNPNGYVLMLDDADTIRRKFKRAVTDSGDEIAARADKPGIGNLLSIYAAFTGRTVEAAEKECAGLGYGDFKLRVADAVIAGLEPIQARFADYMRNKDYLTAQMQRGAEAAAHAARKTLEKVYRKMGFIRL